MSSHCNRYPGCGCGPVIGTKCHMVYMGISETIGELFENIKVLPRDAEFGFRNQPVQSLYYDKERNFAFFQSPIPHEAFVLTNDFNQFQAVHGRWSDVTFGSRTALGPLNHLLKEVKEVIGNPKDIEEYADCGLLLMDSLRLSGFSMFDLHRAMVSKFEKNKLRKWGKPDENGTVEHIRD